jgi:amino acid transporter
MADAVLPIGGLLVVLAILNSCLANANAGATAATRSLFAMGRASLLPRWFGAIQPNYKSPVNAINFQVVFGLVIAVALGFVLADDPFPASGPLNVYVWLGTMIGLLFAFMYIAVNVACIGFYLREGRSEFNVIKHVVVPVLGVLAMIPAVLAVIGGVTIPILNITLPPYQNSLQYTAPVVGIWLVLGIVAFFVLRARNPEALARVDDIYGGDSVATAEGRTSI